MKVRQDKGQTRSRRRHGTDSGWKKTLSIKEASNAGENASSIKGGLGQRSSYLFCFLKIAFLSWVSQPFIFPEAIDQGGDIRPGKPWCS